MSSLSGLFMLNEICAKYLYNHFTCQLNVVIYIKKITGAEPMCINHMHKNWQEYVLHFMRLFVHQMCYCKTVALKSINCCKYPHQRLHDGTMAYCSFVNRPILKGQSYLLFECSSKCLWIFILSLCLIGVYLQKTGSPWGRTNNLWGKKKFRNKVLCYQREPCHYPAKNIFFTVLCTSWVVK